MPKINSNEKRLLLILGGAVFLLANGFGYVLVSNAMGGIDREKQRLAVRLRSLEEARSKSGEAEEKGAWIEANLRPYENEGVRETYLDNLFTGEMTNGVDVELTKNQPMPTITGLYFIKSRYRMNVTGPWPDVKEFLWRVQKPEEFRFIPKLTMVPRKNEADDAEQLVEVQMEVEKWWPKPDDFIDTEAAPAAENLEQPGAPAVEPPAGDTPAPAPTPEATPANTPTPTDNPVPPAAAPPPEIPTDTPKPNP